MTVKDEILKVFEKQRGEFISGEELATRLNVSRNAVWKAVKSLQMQGYGVEAVSNKGYSLSQETDILSSQSINKFLQNDIFQIEVMEQTTSTNDVVREYAEKGEKEGKVVVAKYQTEGRGRLQRKFYSPINTGVYFSVLLRPKFSLSLAPFITTACAVAVSKAIEEVSNREAKIKWVNDIYIDNKKVSGILTEAKLNLENASFGYVVLGIGINVLTPQEGFESCISNIATSVFERKDYTPDKKSKLIASVLENFFIYYSQLEKKEFVQKYIERSCVIGRTVQVVLGEEKFIAKVLQIDNDCRLVVQFENGEIRKFNSGEISTILT